ncbi:hypothetical protein [Bradyrhizobium japonicum]|uniref:hypothetical protein n=1 Tax=Bradyrhizobium japonicum TaxID=375 RepID=UPI0012FE3150|nr:hypothetical protein [Bradyrhizobium japonicum]
MNLLYPLFKAASSLPIADPHAGYEGELIACGAKPIAVIDETQPSEGWELVPSKMDIRDTQQRAIADEAVAQGKILKYKLTVSPPELCSLWDSTQTLHFYCQPQFKDDMMELVEAYRHNLLHGEFGKLSRESGYYFGCTDTDFKHPLEGPAFKALWFISPVTRYCRAQALKHEAMVGTIRLRTKPDPI